MSLPTCAFQVENFDPPPDDELICSICCCVFCDPVEVPCRHVFCKACITNWLAVQKTCPVCRKRAFQSSLQSVIPLLRNMIMKLTLRCPNTGQGCTAKISLENYESHRKICEYEMVECVHENCAEKFARKDAANHELKDCKHRLLRCQRDCLLLLSHNTVKKHNCLEELRKHIAAKEKIEKDLKKQLAEQQKQIDQLKKEISAASERNSSHSVSSLSDDDDDDYVIQFDEASRDNTYYLSNTSTSSTTTVSDVSSSDTDSQENMHFSDISNFESSVLQDSLLSDISNFDSTTVLHQGSSSLQETPSFSSSFPTFLVQSGSQENSQVSAVPLSTSDSINAVVCDFNSEVIFNGNNTINVSSAVENEENLHSSHSETFSAEGSPSFSRSEAQNGTYEDDSDDITFSRRRTLKRKKIIPVLSDLSDDDELYDHSSPRKSAHEQIQSNNDSVQSSPHKNEESTESRIDNELSKSEDENISPCATNANHRAINLTNGAANESSDLTFAKDDPLENDTNSREDHHSNISRQSSSGRISLRKKKLFPPPELANNITGNSSMSSECSPKNEGENSRSSRNRPVVINLQMSSRSRSRQLSGNKSRGSKYSGNQNVSQGPLHRTLALLERYSIEDDPEWKPSTSSDSSSQSSSHSPSRHANARRKHISLSARQNYDDDENDPEFEDFNESESSDEISSGTWESDSNYEPEIPPRTFDLLYKYSREDSDEDSSWTPDTH